MNSPDALNDSTRTPYSTSSPDQNTATAGPAAVSFAPDKSTVVRQPAGDHDPAGETRPRPHAAATGVAGFLLVREIARGGMGTVYAAHDPVFDREVAVKVMHADQNADRFVVESKVTAQLPHPGVPPVYAMGTLPDGRPFLAMKLIRGRTLADELRAADRTAELPRLLGLFERICETVGFAHANGVVHRDLKPANVMVGSFGEVLVMDWGLAKETRSAERETRDEGCAPAAEPSSVPHSALRTPRWEETVAGGVKGTPAYMAPEQARGEPVDCRADVFALGGILAAVLTAKPPFVSDSVIETVEKAARAQVSDCYARLGECGADGELIALAKRCLAPAAADRPANGSQVATAVGAYRAGVQERLRQAERERAAADARAAEEANTRREAEAKVREQRRRRRAQSAAAAAVTAGLLIAAAGGGYYLYRQNLDLKATAAREQAVAEARGQCANRLATAETAMAQCDWAAASAAADGVATATGPEPALADLNDRAVKLRTAAENVRQFVAHRDRLMYHAVLAQEETDRAFHQQAARSAARAGLLLFDLGGAPPPALPFDGLGESVRRWLADSCYETYLTWADVEAADPAAPPEERAHKALGLLDRAAGLGVSTQAWHLRRAELYRALKDAARARDEQERADAVTATGAVDHFLLGAAANRAGRLDDASRHFKRVLELNPGHFWSNYYLATCFMRERPQHFERALSPLTACIQLKPQFVWAYLLRGLANGALGDFETAAADFDRAEKLAPDDTARYGLLTNRAVVNLRASSVREERARRARAGGRADAADREGRLADQAYEAAVGDLTRAAALRPDQPQAHANLADAALHRGRLDAALPPLNRAVELAPTAALYRKRAQLHASRRDHAAALRDTDEAVRLGAGKDDAEERAADQLQRGQILFRLKKWGDALAAFDAALALTPDRAAAHQARGEALLELGRYAEAAAAMDRYQKTGPPQALASRARGLCRAKLGQYAGAAEDYTRALEIERAEGKPADAPTLALRGWAYLVLDAPKLALRDFDAAVQRPGGHRADALAGRGCARIQSGQWRLAVQDTEAALREEEPKARTLLNAARVYAQASDRAVAGPIRQAEMEEAVVLRDRYRAEALKLLRRACDLIPPAERAAFWDATVHPDPAFASVRATAEYRQMAAAFAAKM